MGISAYRRIGAKGILPIYTIHSYTDAPIRGHQCTRRSNLWGPASVTTQSILSPKGPGRSRHLPATIKAWGGGGGGRGRDFGVSAYGGAVGRGGGEGGYIQTFFHMHVRVGVADLGSSLSLHHGYLFGTPFVPQVFGYEQTDSDRPLEFPGCTCHVPITCHCKMGIRSARRN